MENDPGLYYETVSIAISRGDVDLLTNMWKQSLNYGSVGRVIRTLINENICAIAKTAGVPFTFQETVSRWRVKHVQDLFEEEAYNQLIELIEDEPVYRQIIIDYLQDKRHKFARFEGLVRVVYALLREQARQPRNYTHSPALLLDVIEDLLVLKQGEDIFATLALERQISEQIILYFLQLIVEHDDVVTYKYLTSLEYPDILGSTADALKKGISRQFLKRHRL